MDPVTDSTTIITRDFQVGDWLVRPMLHRVDLGEETVQIEPKSMAVLVDLAGHAGKVRSKRRLLHVVWGNAFVSDDVLTHAIWELRKAFGDDSKDPLYIETIPRKGYRLIAPVTWPSETEDESISAFHYKDLERLGGGGMGVVYKAIDTSLDRTVALKFLPPELSEDHIARRRFIREAKSAAQLDHPNIATVHGIGEGDDGRTFIAMAYYEGETVKKKIEQAGTSRQPLPIPLCLDLAEQVARGLSAAHQHGIIHRDIKPANVMVTGDDPSRPTAKIVDFGLAKLAGTTSLTRAGQTPGTVVYMSPEQLLNRDIDHRTDLWSLGVVLYEMVAGKRPFKGDSGGTAIQAILNEEPESLLDVRADCPHVVSNIVDALLRKEPGERLGNTNEVANRLADARLSSDLTETMQTPKDLASGVQAMRPKSHWIGRVRGRFQPAVTWGSVTLLAALLISSVVWWRNQGTASPDVGPITGVLVSDFRNETGDADYELRARAAVAAALERSSDLRVLSHEHLFDVLMRMERPESTFVDETIAREVCLREHLSVFVTGSVQSSGQTTQLAVRAIEAASGTVIYTGAIEFSAKEELFDSTDLLVSELLAVLEQERRLETAEHLEKVTTHSLTALQLYSQALARQEQGDGQGAVRLLKSALRLDTDFAMANLELGRSYASHGNSQDMGKHFGLAFEQRGSATQRERLLIEGYFHGSRQDYERQAEAFEALLALFPDNLEAHAMLANAYRALGDLTSGAREYREVTRLDPDNDSAHGYVISFLALDGDYEGALEAHTRALDIGLESPQLLRGLGLAYVGRGELERSKTAFDQLEAAGGSFGPHGTINLARLAIFRGHLEDAEQLLQEGISSDQLANRHGWELMRRHMLSRILKLQGMKREALREVEATLQSRAELWDRDYRAIGSLLAELGETDRAREVLDTLTRIASVRTDSFLDHCIFHLEAEIAFSEGRFDASRKLFRNAYAAYPAFVSQMGIIRSYYASRDFKGALSDLENMQLHPVAAFSSLSPASWLLALLLVAEMNQSQGNDTTASQLCGELRSLWEEPPVWRDSINRICPLGNATLG